MSRNEGSIGPGDAAAVDWVEILAEIEANAARQSRQAAVARYLAAGEGWREASARFAARSLHGSCETMVKRENMLARAKLTTRLENIFNAALLNRRSRKTSSRSN